MNFNQFVEYNCFCGDCCYRQAKMLFVYGDPHLTEADMMTRGHFQNCYIHLKSNLHTYQYGNTVNLNDYCGTGINMRSTGQWGWTGAGNNPNATSSNPDWIYWWYACAYCHVDYAFSTWLSSPWILNEGYYKCEVPPPNNTLHLIPLSGPHSCDDYIPTGEGIPVGILPSPTDSNNECNGLIKNLIKFKLSKTDTRAEHLRKLRRKKRK